MGMGSGGGGIGSIFGMVVGGVAGSFFPGAGTMIGISIGGMLGGMLGGILFPPDVKKPKVEPSRLNMPTSQYGIAIPVIYGTRLVTGNCIWYGNFKTIRHETESGDGGGGKGGGGGGGGTVAYTYSASFAFGLSINSIRILKIWKGKTKIPITNATFYNGSQNAPDPHIRQILSAKGKTRFPVWKKLCYVVFKDFDLGPNPSVPIFTFEVSHAPAGETSEPPSDIVKDILTNTFYGAGLPESYLNLPTFCAVREACNKDDMLLDIKADTQISILDFIEYVTKHHNGMITYNEGQILYHQLHKDMQPSNAVDDDDYVRDGSKPALIISYKGERELYNKVIVEYTKASKNYVPGTTFARDNPDIAITGLRDTTIKLDALSTYARANKMAQRLLNRYMSNPKLLKARLGVKSRDYVKPGRQIYFSDAQTGLPQTLFTIVSTREADDYTIDVEALQENPEDYNVTVIGDDNTDPPEQPDLIADASPVIRPMAIEIPSLYASQNSYVVTYSAPSEQQWAGSTLYKSYISNSNYTALDKTAAVGVTGIVTGVGVDNYTAYVTVTLDSGYTLESAIDFDTLIASPNKNLCIFRTSAGDKFIRFEDAVLQSGTTWKLSGLIYDTLGEPLYNTTGAIATNDNFAFYSTMPYSKKLADTELNRTLYLKLPSYNLAGAERDLSTATEITLVVKGLDDKPLPPWGVKVNGISLSSSAAITVANADIQFEWRSRNRNNLTVEGRTDIPGDDVDLQYFEIIFENGATYRRSAQQMAKTYNYTWAQKSSDGTTSPFTCRIRQVGTKGVSDDYVATITFI